MKQRLPVITAVGILMILLITAGILYTVFSASAPAGDVRISAKKADDDFSSLLSLVRRDAYDLATVEVSKVCPGQALVEKYDAPTLVYTEITGKVLQDVTGEIGQKNIRILLLGDADAFPNREPIKEGRVYLFRLERWADENGTFYLLSPLEKLYYRVHEGNIMVRDSADTANYRIAMPLDEFTEKYASALRTGDRAEKHASHVKEVKDKISGFDYAQQDLAEFAKKNVNKEKRLQNAEKMFE